MFTLKEITELYGKVILTVHDEIAKATNNVLDNQKKFVENTMKKIVEFSKAI